tara:strand:- start:6997 stop:7182 length:186 start_codon:yes stop_codon:yes gene_type:complete
MISFYRLNVKSTFVPMSFGAIIGFGLFTVDEWLLCIDKQFLAPFYSLYIGVVQSDFLPIAG